MTIARLKDMRLMYKSQLLSYTSAMNNWCLKLKMKRHFTLAPKMIYLRLYPILMYKICMSKTIKL